MNTPLPWGTAPARLLLAVLLVTTLLGAEAQAARYTSTVAGGTAFRDRNGSGAWEEGEISATTREDGTFNLKKGKGRLYISGGKDLLTGVDNSILFTTPPATRAISSLTSLWQALRDRSQGSRKIKKLLNIPKGSTLVNYVAKPISQEVRPKRITLIKRDAQHHTLVQFLKDLAKKAQSANQARVAQRLAVKPQAARPKEDYEVGALADALINPDVTSLAVVDWTDPATLEIILTRAIEKLGLSSKITPAEIKQAATDLAAINQKIEQGIIEPSIPPQIATITAETQAEGTPLTYRVTLLAPAPTTLNLDLTLGSQSATGADYGALTFSDGVTATETGVSVPAGVGEFTVTVPTVDDALFEGNETLGLT
ncbi:MAG: hypothetical protein FIA97_17420, partial [Methylococcaceae bacterium]|nr:hypothetical protein [Methylococcaceae bacterium]